MAIVYRHRRLDTFKVFYVGIGLHKKRAYDRSNRSDWWKRVTKKAGYIVEILYDDVSIDDAKELEELLIEEYGRIDMGTGILINMTGGGDGVKELSKDVIDRAASKRSKYVEQYDKDGVFISSFKSIREAGEFNGIDPKLITSNISNRTKTAGGYIWKAEKGESDKEISFDNVYKEYKTLVYNIAYNITKRKDFAEDISQDTFINVYNSLSNGKKPSNVKAWISTIAKNNSLKYINKELKSNEYKDEESFYDVDTIDGDTIYNLAYNVVNKLGEKFLFVFIYYFKYGYTTIEIAEELEISDNLVRQRLFKIRKILEELTKYNI